MSQPAGDLNSTINHLWSVIVRHRWWVLVGTVTVSLAVIRYSFFIPDRYRSEATIFISKPTVQQQYVLLNNTVTSLDAVDAIRREVLSRANLQRLIEEYNLYPGRRKLGSAALSDLMRTDIEAQPVSKDPERRPMNAFIIAFTGPDPRVAQQITNQLTAMFINANLQKQSNLNTGTTDFLQKQVDAAKAELDQQEAIVRDYKLRNLGSLPEQSAGNMEVLNGLQIQLQGAEESLRRARQERTYLQAMLSQYAPGTASGPAALPGSEVALGQEIAKLRNQRDDLLSRYSARYPDVIALNQQIGDDEAQLARMSAQRKAAADGAQGSPQEAALPTDPAALQLRSQLQANTVEIEDAQQRTKQLAGQIASYQGRLTLAPVREQQFAEIQRSYQAAKDNYTNLLNKVTQSDLATKMEVQQVHEQFQVIDPASLPLHPVGPNRQKIALGGLAGGIVFGLGLAFFLDARDRSFHSEVEVRRYLPVPIVVGIPPLRTAEENRKLARRARLEWALGCLLVLCLVAAQLFVYHRS